MQRCTIDDYNCVVCDNDLEDYNHLFLSCPLIISLWLNSRWQIKMDAFKDWHIKTWIEELLNPSNLFPVSAVERMQILNFAVICMEHVWMLRNQVRNGQQLPDWTEISVTVNNVAQKYWDAHALVRRDSKVTNFKAKTCWDGSSTLEWNG